MANVPYTGVPEVAPSPAAGNDYLNVQVQPNQFRQVGQAFEGLGQQTEKMGDVLAQGALARQGLMNETMARDAGIRAMQDFGKAAAAYESKRGQDAVAGYEPYQQQLASIRDQNIASMPNPMAKKLLADQTAFLMSRMMMSGAAHSAQQNIEWQKESHAAQIETAGAMASGPMNNNDDILETNAAQVRDSAGQIARMNGGDDEVVKAQQQMKLGKFWQETVTTRAMRDPISAQALFSKHRGDMDAVSQIRTAEMLRPKLKSYQADAIASQILGAAGGGGDVFERGIIPQESGGKQTDARGAPLTSSAGAVGVAQVMPDTAKLTAAQHGIPYSDAALRTDAGYNKQLGRAYFGDMLTRFGGDVELATAAYNAGPERVDRAVAKNGRDNFLQAMPAETQAYVPSVLKRVGAPSSPLATMPDKSAAYEKAIALTRDDPDLQQAVLSKINQQFNLNEARTATERRDLNESFPDMAAAAEKGMPISIPEDRIRQAFPPDEADRRITRLQIASHAGEVYKAIQFGSPDQVQAALNDLGSGMGPVSTMLHTKLAGAKGGETVTSLGPDGASGVVETPEQFRMRQGILGSVQRVVNERREALLTDPANYAQGEPNVLTAARAFHANPSPQTAQDYSARTLGVQDHLGVPPELQHVLTRQDAQAYAANLSKQDASVADGADLVKQIGQHYGPYASKVWGDLVKLGGLSPEWQTLGQIDDPSARSDYQRNLQYATQKGGAAALKKELPEGAQKEIDVALHDSLSDLRGSLFLHGAAADPKMAEQQRAAIELMATANVSMRNMTGTAAVKDATDKVLGGFDFVPNANDSGVMMRIPKGYTQSMKGVPEAIQNTLRPEDMSSLRYPGLTEDQGRQEAARAAREGVWFTNPAGDGIQLWGKTTPRQGGGYAAIRRANGTPIELKFRDAASATPGEGVSPTSTPSAMP